MALYASFIQTMLILITARFQTKVIWNWNKQRKTGEYNEKKDCAVLIAFTAGCTVRLQERLKQGAEYNRAGNNRTENRREFRNCGE